MGLCREELVHENLREHFSQSRLARYFTVNLDDEGRSIVRALHLLTDVPVLYVANVDEAGVNGNEYSKIVKEIVHQYKQVIQTRTYYEIV